MTLFHTCCETLHRSGGGMKVNERRTVVGGWLATVSPQPWREIAASWVTKVGTAGWQEVAFFRQKAANFRQRILRVLRISILRLNSTKWGFLIPVPKCCILLKFRGRGQLLPLPPMQRSHWVSRAINKDVIIGRIHHHHQQQQPQQQQQQLSCRSSRKQTAARAAV